MLKRDKAWSQASRNFWRRPVLAEDFSILLRKVDRRMRKPGPFRTYRVLS